MVSPNFDILSICEVIDFQSRMVIFLAARNTKDNISFE